MGTFKTVDHFLMHIKLGEKVCDAQLIMGRPNNNHEPVLLKLNVTFSMLRGVQYIRVCISIVHKGVGSLKNLHYRLDPSTDQG
jgi:hypothetical protein